MQETIDLLKNLIRTPSFSKKEAETAEILEQYFYKKNIPTERLHNNIIVRNKHYAADKKTIVLNSHHDTVKVNAGWTFDPFEAIETEGKIVGLGSNDAGASLVCLAATFIHFFDKKTPWNLVFIASGEEENGGDNGIRSVLKKYDFNIDLTIVGEPTEMQPAIAEKGLLVIDAVAKGEAGHAARPNGKNAIDMAVKDIAAINQLCFSKLSPTLGAVVKSVTQIEAGYRHNVIPDVCKFVIDVRVNDCYSLEEAVEILQQECRSDLLPRSFKNRPSAIKDNHPIILKTSKLGLKPFGSATLSDQVNFRNPSIKIGPGKSTRSHQADEFVLVSEIEEGLRIYREILTDFEF